jgi:hypothetical protein
MNHLEFLKLANGGGSGSIGGSSGGSGVLFTQQR